MLFLGDKFWPGSSYDEVIAFEFWCHAAGADKSTLWHQVVDILHARQHAVRRIAEQLMRRPRLGQVQIVRAIGDV
jgi:hypothetical protein